MKIPAFITLATNPPALGVCATAIITFQEDHRLSREGNFPDREIAAFFSPQMSGKKTGPGLNL